MKLQFNLFGFNVQVTRPVRYGCTLLVGDWDHSAFAWERTSSSLRWCYFQGWKLARTYAKLYAKPITFVVWEISPDGLHRQKRHGTIGITKTVNFFSK